MALVAETLVEEWLNRKGYFTIRGTKTGRYEMDLLAVHPQGDGPPSALHIEVQASTDSSDWLAKWTKNLQQELGVPEKSNRKRTREQMLECAQEWVEGKFRNAAVSEARERLWPGAEWTFSLVHADLAHPEEMEAVAAQGVEIVDLTTVLDELIGVGKETPKTSSEASDIAALVGFYGA